MIEKAADLLDRLAGVASELGCRVPEDVDTGQGQPCGLEVLAKVGVDRAGSYAVRWIRA